MKRSRVVFFALCSVMSVACGSSSSSDVKPVLQGTYGPVGDASKAEFSTLTFIDATRYSYLRANCNDDECDSRGTYTFDGQASVELTDPETQKTEHLSLAAISTATASAEGPATAQSVHVLDGLVSNGGPLVAPDGGAGGPLVTSTPTASGPTITQATMNGVSMALQPPKPAVVPPYVSTAQPLGYAAGVTGGAGGEVVTVTTGAELEEALCNAALRVKKGGFCNDNIPRVIQLPEGHVFNFKAGGADAPATPTATATVCAAYEACKAPTASEYILAIQNRCPNTTFPVTIDTAPEDPMVVGSNKTIVGLGAGAKIKGRGFRIGTDFLDPKTNTRSSVRTTNVILRNVTIADLNPQVIFAGDAVSIVNADGVWIDHNRFHNIGRQMIVTGTGQGDGLDAATHTTISWNEFDGTTDYAAFCDGRHYWTLLFDASSDQVTVMDNWIHDVSGRAPALADTAGTAHTIHLVNNYYSNLKGTGLQVEGPAQYALVEGNSYEFVAPSYPIIDQGDDGMLSGGHVWAPTAPSNDCTSLLGRPCQSNVLSAKPQQAFEQDSAALAPFAKAARKGWLVSAQAAASVASAVQQQAGVGHI